MLKKKNCRCRLHIESVISTFEYERMILTTCSDIFGKLYFRISNCKSLDKHFRTYTDAKCGNPNNRLGYYSCKLNSNSCSVLRTTRKLLVGTSCNFQFAHLKLLEIEFL